MTVTGRDLLQLDRDACFPNCLRRQWIQRGLPDPLALARGYEQGLKAGLAGVMASAMTGVVLVLGLFSDNFSQNHHLVGSVSGLLITALVVLILGLTHMTVNGEGGKEFAKAIGELAHLLSFSHENLDGLGLKTLKEEAREHLVNLASKILEHEAANGYDAAQALRESFDRAHNQFRAFGLVHSAWGTYFKEARAKLEETKARGSADPEADLLAAAPLKCEANGGEKPSGGLLGLIARAQELATNSGDGDDQIT